MRFLIKPVKLNKIFGIGRSGCTGIDCDGFSICVYD